MDSQHKHIKYIQYLLPIFQKSIWLLQKTSAWLRGSVILMSISCTKQCLLSAVSNIGFWVCADRLCRGCTMLLNPSSRIYKISCNTLFCGKTSCLILAVYLWDYLLKGGIRNGLLKNVIHKFWCPICIKPHQVKQCVSSGFWIGFESGQALSSLVAVRLINKRTVSC